MAAERPRRALARQSRLDSLRDLMPSTVARGDHG